MCGICGYIGCHRPELLEPMCSVMAHRGPDDSGTWYHAEREVGLGHRRLSIIDLSPAGHQPMANWSGTIHLSFNGEIYNFPELRDSLEKKGYRFRGHSDTEVLLYLYEEYGIDSLNMLNGMFAFAVWDDRRRELLLARDHAGIKPLYYWQDGPRLFFASEIKALLRIPEIPRRLNHGAIPQYLTFLWVPGEETMLEFIRKVEPGHYLQWKDGRVTSRQWFHLDHSPDRSIAEREWPERIREAFLQTTRRQMIADTPLGAFLSGGLDSSSIVACMRKSFPDRDISCYSIGYDKGGMAREGFQSDLPYAQKVAEFHNVSLKVCTFSDEMQGLLPKLVYQLDEPDADPAAILTYLISRMASSDGVKVLLSGTGGDEVFFGYRSHRAYKYYHVLDRLPPPLVYSTLWSVSRVAQLVRGPQSALARRFAKLSRGFNEKGLDRHVALVDWSTPENRSRLIRKRFTGAEVRAPLQKYFDSFSGLGEIHRHSHVLINSYLASHNLVYSDKSTMAASVEGRFPFLDVELMKLAASIPEKVMLAGSGVKPLLTDAMKPVLPREVINRSKTGFGVPLRQWVLEGLSPLVSECLSPRRVQERGVLVPHAVQEMIEENKRGRDDHGFLIYALLSLELWQLTFIDRPGIELTL